MRRLRWIVYAPVAVIAFFVSPVQATEYITWTCISDTQWQMQQPLIDYQAGLYPQWSDCEAWRDGTPQQGWQWSYGAGVATTTSSSSSVAVTSSVQPTTTSSLPEASSTSTTEPPTTTTETTTTTTQAAPTTLPIPQTSTWVEPTEPATTSTEVSTTTTTTVPVVATSLATSVPVLPSTSVATASESTDPRVTTPPTFIFNQSEISETATTLILEMQTPSADATDEEKQQFENAVNIFDGTHDDYIPSGSTITVAQRRSIVAASTILMTLPTPTASRRKK